MLRTVAARKRIDGLRVVADHGEAVCLAASAPAGSRTADGWCPDIRRPGRDRSGRRLSAASAGSRHDLRPVQEQIVVIEHVLALLGLDIGREQLLQLGRPAGAPGKRQAQHLLERVLGVDAAGIDRKAGALWRESGARFSKSRGSWRTRLIRSAESSRSWIVKAGSRPIRSAYSRSSRAPMPWKVPAQASASVMMPALSPSTLRAMRSTPLRHLASGAAGKCHQQDASRVGAVDDQMGDAMGQRVGLAGAGTGNDQ